MIEFKAEMIATNLSYKLFLGSLSVLLAPGGMAGLKENKGR